MPTFLQLKIKFKHLHLWKRKRDMEIERHIHREMETLSDSNLFKEPLKTSRVELSV